MNQNVGSFDRAARQTVGIMMTALALSGTVTGAAGGVLVGLGVALIVTGTVGRCLLYRALGWSTAASPA